MTNNFFRSIRPLVSLTYVAICLCDFIIFPILWVLIQRESGLSITPWVPLTLDNSGLLHLSFGAAIGIHFHGRTREKLQGVDSFRNDPDQEFDPQGNPIPRNYYRERDDVQP